MANKTTKSKATTETTEVICIIDRSTSMSHLVEATIEGFNAFIKDQQNEVGNANLTLCLFDGKCGSYALNDGEDIYEIVYDGIDISKAPELTNKVYKTKGCTALYDAMGSTIESVYSRIKKAKKADRPDKVVCLVITDGAENASEEYTREAVLTIVKNLKKKHWAFVFIGANIDEMAVSSSVGVSRGSTLGYDATTRGTQVMYNKMSAAVTMSRGVSVNDANYESVADNLMAETVDDDSDADSSVKKSRKSKSSSK